MYGGIHNPAALAALTVPAVLLAVAQVAVARETPNEWLQEMSAVVGTTDFEGTVIRRQNGKFEAFKVVRKIVDGVINERLVTQEGNGLEIIRVGTEVHCILPDKKSVLIEQWDNQSTLFAALPSSEILFGSEYDLAIVRPERVAGRKAMLLAIRPHDSYRFGHRLWLDDETAFPLRTELVGVNGELIEQLKFADITLGAGIPQGSLATSFDLDDFTWYAQPRQATPVEIETDWVCDDLPPGFRTLSTTREQLPGRDDPVTRIVYGDGLATVSVFVGEKQGKSIAERSSVGASSSYSTEIGDHQVTAVGEVPAETVQRIASAMRRR